MIKLIIDRLKEKFVHNEYLEKVLKNILFNPNISCISTFYYKDEILHI